MTRIAVVYFSQEDATHHLALALCEGIRAEGAKTEVHRIVPDDLVGCLLYTSPSPRDRG